MKKQVNIHGPRPYPPMKHSKFSLPGLALAHRTYDGFGKELFLPSSEDDEEVVKELEKEFGFEDEKLKE